MRVLSPERLPWALPLERADRAGEPQSAPEPERRPEWSCSHSGTSHVIYPEWILTFRTTSAVAWIRSELRRRSAMPSRGLWPGRQLLCPASAFDTGCRRASAALLRRLLTLLLGPGFLLFLWAAVYYGRGYSPRLSPLTDNDLFEAHVV